MKKKIIVITGPTAVGKSKIGVEIAKEFSTEIISCDSVQVYKYLDIGSGKISIDEMQGIKHHMIDIILPDENYSLFDYKNDAKKHIENIYLKNNIPIIIGGTGFYISSIIYDNDYIIEKKDDLYSNYLKKLSNEELFKILYEKDIESYKKININNRKRIIRALEFIQNTNIKFSDYNNEQSKKESPYEFYYIVLFDDREKLYNRINNRVDKMIEDGLIFEVEKLNKMGYDTRFKSMNSIGYLEINNYLRGIYSLEDSISLIKKNSRHYAKRQLTWFRREKNSIWINIDNKSTKQIVDEILKILE